MAGSELIGVEQMRRYACAADRLGHKKSKIQRANALTSRSRAAIKREWRCSHSFSIGSVRR
jgi:hypothetical protein